MGGTIGHLITPSYHHVVMLGLDGAGKTTVLYRLSLDQYTNTAPTVGFNCEKVKGTLGKSKGVTFNVWDIGGNDRLRPLWSTYMRHTEGIIFVVDSSDTERLEEAKLELYKVARNHETHGVPLVILANKQDLPGALNTAELERRLTLRQLNDTHPWRIAPIIALIGEGVQESIEHLYHLMLAKRKKSKSKIRSRH